MSIGQMIENALGAGLAAALVFGAITYFRSGKPQFFWKMKRGVRSAIVFTVVFILFVILIY
jgi:hypothetical protein